ncbi:FAD-dependent oxidoreductase [[Phormidium] sp. ETS-05]|uniref:flavin monoamine oxidase family protein n=1 Tax=[Phormidium] sp. ETS-05 TaxID=222819 RepID=UPI0018EF0AC5|nr:FAD-dependent oxidoreductase [[Phormidium] sp. ETS-05]
MQIFNSNGSQRRQFLQLALLAAATAISHSCSSNHSMAKLTDKNILIIGAGIAGIAAARKLTKNGFNVKILEGRNRIGGRINTNRSLGLAVDLGAAWIHGSTDNPITTIATEFKLNINQTDYENIQVYNSEGKSLSESALDDAYDLYDTIIEEVENLADRLDADISLGEGWRRAIRQQKISPKLEKILKWYMSFELELDNGTDLDNLSLWYVDDDEAFDGEDYIFPNGYDQIIEGLAKGLEIELSQKVTEVIWSDSGVEVKTATGNQYTADAALLTLPLGVLKSNQVKFSPNLPLGKRHAIENLSMGVYNKVVLKFPEIFWPAQRDFLGYVSDKQPDFGLFLNLSRHGGEPVLVALTAGSFAKSLESLSDEELQAKVMEVLRRLYGTNIPEPIQMLRTSWSQDPFSFGSYSYIPVGATMEDRETLAAPVGKRLFFAGEATSTQYPATVHGALLSGLRGAKEIKRRFKS